MEKQNLMKLEKSFLGSKWKKTTTWVADGVLYFCPFKNEKATNKLSLLGCTLQVADKSSQRTGLFFHTVSGHRFTVVQGQSKHIFACDTEETLQQWTSYLRNTMPVGGNGSAATASTATPKMDAEVRALMEELTSLKSKNSALKLKRATKKSQAALNDENISKTDTIKLLLQEKELLHERNAQLKGGEDDEVSPEQAEEIKSLILKLNAAKSKNAELKSSMTAAQIADCFEAARVAKNAKIEQLMEEIKVLQTTNDKLKNPGGEEEDDEFTDTPSEYESSPRSRKGKRPILRHSMSKTIKTVTHITNPVQTGKLKKRKAGMAVQRWNGFYFELGEGRLLAYMTEAKKTCKGELSLADATEVKQQKKNIIVSLADGDLVLQASNAKQAEKWVAAFEGMIGDAK